MLVDFELHSPLDLAESGSLGRGIRAESGPDAARAPSVVLWDSLPDVAVSAGGVVVADRGLGAAGGGEGGERSPACGARIVLRDFAGHDERVSST